jgi:hypothetical protein
MVFGCFVPEDGLLGCCFHGVLGGTFGRLWRPRNKIIKNYMPKGSYGIWGGGAAGALPGRCWGFAAALLDVPALWPAK